MICEQIILKKRLVVPVFTIDDGVKIADEHDSDAFGACAQDHSISTPSIK